MSRIIASVPIRKGQEKKRRKRTMVIHSPRARPWRVGGIDAENVMISSGPVITERERASERKRGGQRVEDTENNLIIGGDDYSD